MSKIYKVTQIDNELLDLYIKCSKNNPFLKERTDGIHKNKSKKIFDYYIKYGNVLAINKFGKKRAFILAMNIEDLYKDKEAFYSIYDMEKYPKIDKFLQENNYSGNYIVILAIDRKLRNKGTAIKLINYYLNNYKSASMFMTDVDNKFDYKVFKKLGFNETKLDNNYYIMYKGERHE